MARPASRLRVSADRVAMLHRLSLVAACAVAVAFILTLDRAPVTWDDANLYASIARAKQVEGVGTPSMLRASPRAVDHIAFYGPVFFDLAVQSMNTVGVRRVSVRLISLFAAWLVAVAAAGLAYQIGGRAGPAALVGALTLLTPEVGFHATAGSMDLLAVGFEVAALAAFAAALTREPRRLGWALACGGLLTLAALTTPRTYPFILACAVCGIWLPWGRPDDRRAARLLIAVALGVLAIGLGAWVLSQPGGAAGWLSRLARVAANEDKDVALLPRASRAWAFLPSRALTPAFALVLGGLSLWPLTAGIVRDRRRAAAAAALATGLLTLAIGIAITNLTFAFTTYIALPLLIAALACVTAIPARPEGLGRACAAALSLLLACDVLVAGVRYARIAATWDARDPAPVAAFVQDHVPPGSIVAGPLPYYFWAVEQEGSEYRLVSAASPADWTRWFAPTTDAPAADEPPDRARFLIWPSGDPEPPNYRCATGDVVATFMPQTSRDGWLERVGLGVDRGFPPTTLYRLTEDCPSGYDATADPRPAIGG